MLKMGLESQVNQIRKYFKRSPANFSEEYSYSYRIFERGLQALVTLPR